MVTIAIVARRDRLDDIAQSITEKGGGQVLEITADVSDEAQVIDMVEQTQVKFSKVDVLVNNLKFREVPSPQTIIAWFSNARFSSAASSSILLGRCDALVNCGVSPSCCSQAFIKLASVPVNTI
jgi:NAD(P)-dependent dehydrogenase (short-subunit alcohol dehydrogenase family)